MRRAVGLLAAMLMIAPGCLTSAGEVDDSVRESHVALLSPHRFPVLVIEIDFAEGLEPDPLALDALRDTLASVTGRDRIEILLDEPLPNGGREQEHEWADLRRLHIETFQSSTLHTSGRGDRAFIHVLFLNGVYTHDHDGVSPYGMAIGNSVYVFPDQYRARIGPTDGLAEAPGYATIERAVLIHEFGHALGLVDNGIPMQRPRLHPEDDSHSNNPDSVMYVHIDGRPAALEQFQDNEWVPYQFDADDLADLRAARIAFGDPSVS